MECGGRRMMCTTAVERAYGVRGTMPFLPKRFADYAVKARRLRRKGLVLIPCMQNGYALHAKRLCPVCKTIMNYMYYNYSLLPSRLWSAAVTIVQRGRLNARVISCICALLMPSGSKPMARQSK